MEGSDGQHLVATYVNYGNVPKPAAMSDYQPPMVGNTTQQHAICRSMEGVCLNIQHIALLHMYITFTCAPRPLICM